LARSNGKKQREIFMCTRIQPWISSENWTVDNHSSSKAVFDPKKAVIETMGEIILQKTVNMESAFDDKLRRYNPILIGGDLFTIGYLGFQGAEILVPSMAQIPMVAVATVVCGVVAGVINIGVGLVSLKESVQAFRNGDKVLGARLMLDFVCCLGIGTIMILASLATKVTALAGIGLFFTANPWLLPVLFFVATIPLIAELGYRIQRACVGADLGSQLQLNQLQELLTSETPDWARIDALYADLLNPLNLGPFGQCGGLREKLSDKMEELQADMGVSAAIEAFTLLQHVQKRSKSQALGQIAALQKTIGDWNRSLYIRMFQQVLFFIAFGLSMGALSPHANVNLLNGVQSFFLTGGNVIPLYMDIFWPFKRNAPIVVPKVEFNTEKESALRLTAS
jgi:hypothetical protein